MPGGVIKLIGGTKYNWAFKTVPQRHLNGRTLVLPQGKGLGGLTNPPILTDSYLPELRRGGAADFRISQLRGRDASAKGSN
jgi:choline dehydrogenase-like flavoprotein